MARRNKVLYKIFASFVIENLHNAKRVMNREKVSFVSKRFIELLNLKYKTFQAIDLKAFAGQTKRLYLD